MKNETCPKCQGTLKLTLASKLSDFYPYVWKCGCGLYATETNEDYLRRQPNSFIKVNPTVNN